MADVKKMMADTRELRALLAACTEAEIWPAEKGYSDACIQRGEWKIAQAILNWKASLNG